ETVEVSVDSAPHQPHTRRAAARPPAPPTPPPSPRRASPAPARTPVPPRRRAPPRPPTRPAPPPGRTTPPPPTAWPARAPPPGHRSPPGVANHHVVQPARPSRVGEHRRSAQLPGGLAPDQSAGLMARPIQSAPEDRLACHGVLPSTPVGSRRGSAGRLTRLLQFRWEPPPAARFARWR